MADQIEEMMQIGKRKKEENKERKRDKWEMKKKRWKEKEEEEGKKRTNGEDKIFLKITE